MSDYRKLPVSYIKVGKRYRKDLGGLSTFADSIREVGLIHAIVIDRNHNLIAGQRRLEAWKLAKPDEAVPCVIVDTLDDAAKRLVAERDENTCRQDMTASELYAMGKALEKLERPKAVATQGTRSDLSTSGAKDPEVSHPVRKKVAEGLGLSEAQWTRLKHIGEEAEDGDGDARAALAEIDAGKKTFTRADAELRDANQVLPEGVGSLRSITKRRKTDVVMKRVAEQLDGIAAVLAGLDDIDQIESAEAQAIEASLSRFRTVLSRTISQLRSVA